MNKTAPVAAVLLWGFFCFSCSNLNTETTQSSLSARSATTAEDLVKVSDVTVVYSAVKESFTVTWKDPEDVRATGIIIEYGTDSKEKISVDMKIQQAVIEHALPDCAVHSFAVYATDGNSTYSEAVSVDCAAIPALGDILCTDGTYETAASFASAKKTAAAVVCGISKSDKVFGIGINECTALKNDTAAKSAVVNTVSTLAVSGAAVQAESVAAVPAATTSVSGSTAAVQTASSAKTAAVSNASAVKTTSSALAVTAQDSGYAANYGTAAGLSETPYASNWFVPTISELYTYVYLNRAVVNASLAAVKGDELAAACYFSGSQDKTDKTSALALNLTDGTVVQIEEQVYSADSGCLVRVFRALSDGTSVSSSDDAAVLLFKPSAEQVRAGAEVQLSAFFDGETALLSPGNIKMTSGVPVSVIPYVDTAYTLTVTGNGKTDTATVKIAVYLDGTYRFYHKDSISILQPYFSFAKDGTGTYVWSRKYTGLDQEDCWNCKFDYKISDTSVQLNWTSGTRSGTYSTAKIKDGSVKFEKRLYARADENAAADVTKDTQQSETEPTSSAESVASEDTVESFYTEPTAAGTSSAVTGEKSTEQKSAQTEAAAQ